MKCIEIKDKELIVAERPIPVPVDGEVLIRVHAAGVNRPDILQRLGHYPPPAGVTDILGLEVAGVREDTGEAVCALLSGGGYADYATVPVGQCMLIPAGWSMAEAAALPETLLTVWDNLFLRGGLVEDETVLIHGGASGIGTMAIQLAKAFGARVIVTAGTDAKCAACRTLGANLTINYKTQDFVAAIKDFTGDFGVNIVLDMVGGEYLPRNLEVLAVDGRHVSIAFQQGAKAEVDIKTIMKKRLVLTGSTLRSRTIAEKAALVRSVRDNVWGLIEKGCVRPVIYKIFPLDQAAEAHRALENGDHVGKIVLRMA